MAQIQKSERQVDIKSSAERFFQVFRSKQDLIPKMCPGLIKDIKIIKGDWESVGSIREWSYVVESGPESCNNETVGIDDEKRTMSWRANGETIDKYYKMFKVTIGVSEGSVKWTVEYEKQSNDIPPPNEYMDTVPVLTKNIDDYLSKNA